MNSNLFHNIVNVLITLVALVTAVLLALGCTTLPDGELECGASTLVSPELASWIITLLGIVKLLVNVVRDGFAGLAKKQPPVRP